MMAQEVTAPAQQTLADRHAVRCWEANLLALRQTQPALVELLKSTPPPQISWVFGRDGSLTARKSEGGGWWGGSSLPLAVARSLLRTLNMTGPVSCLLAPVSGGQILAALEHSTPSQAILVVMPELDNARVALGSQDFADEIADGRLWLACGPQWPAELESILDSHSGLCVPGQYIRTCLLSDSEVESLVALAGPIVSAQAARRTEGVAELRSRWTGGQSDRVCVVSQSRFQLWDFAGKFLGEMADTRTNWKTIETDRPNCASAFALAEAVQDCDAVLAADLYRAELPDGMSEQLPWITWATVPPRCAPIAAATNDRLILADPSWKQLALALGWRSEYVTVGRWPALAQPSPTPKQGPVVFIADAPLQPIPESLKRFSSHAVLWEQIRAELAADPMLAAGDVDAYLDSRIARQEIDGRTLDRSLFMSKLILPAWRRGLARRLIKAGYSLLFYGCGWDEDREFASRCKGPILSMDELRRAAHTATALVHPFPQGFSHAVEALGRPVVRPMLGTDGVATGSIAHSAKPISPELVLSLLARRGNN